MHNSELKKQEILSELDNLNSSLYLLNSEIDNSEKGIVNYLLLLKKERINLIIERFNLLIARINLEEVKSKLENFNARPM